MLLLTSFFIVFVFLLIKARFFIAKIFKQIRLDIASLPTLPIIGHFHRFFKKSSEDAFVATNKFTKNFPSMSKLWQFHHLTICINEPKLVEKVLMSKICMQRPLFLLKFFEVDEGLLSSRYDQWTHDRRFMIQFFSQRSVKNYTKSFFECGQSLTQNLKTIEINSGEFDILPHLEKAAVQGVCSTLFGMSLDDSRVDEIYKQTSIIFEENTKTFEAGLKNPLRFLDVIHRFTENYKKVKNAQDRLTKILTNQSFASEKSFLIGSLLSENGKTFNEKQIREHILTFLNAGLDTTSAHLHYTILFLAMHRESQEKLYHEMKNVPDETDYELIAKLEYLDRVVKESFRLAPPIFLIGRETTEDFEISPGVVIPEGTSLAINTFVLHRRREIFGDASDQFNPDNFLKEKVEGRDNFSFQPFSTGRRNCIGFTFAMVFIKMMLFKLIKSFRFETKSKYDDLRFKYGMTLKLTQDHFVAIKERVP